MGNQTMRRSIIKTSLKLLAELIIVFLGVYCAFLLENYRIRRANIHRKEQIYSTLHKDLTTSLEDFDRMIIQLDSLVFSKFRDAYERGEMPPLRPLFLTGIASTRTWEAMLEVGGLITIHRALSMKFFELLE